jgi:hypothetical protein
MGWYRDELVNNAYKFDFPIHKPYYQLSDADKAVLWSGNKYFTGLNPFFKELEEKNYKIQNRVMLSRYRGKTKCYSCKGKRLRIEPSYNVIAEIRGKKTPKEIITFGGHLDSWDTGEGAHDDGAGVVHCMEALRILKKLNYSPQHTLRVVLFMNEENGNMGGKGYANFTAGKGEKQIAALESDRGGFAPRGFSCDGNQNQVKFLESLAPFFKPYELHVFEKGYGGVDIGPLKNQFPGIPLFGFVPDSQRYFDFHHTPNDIFENVNKRELELGAAAISSFIYLLDVNL